MTAQAVTTSAAPAPVGPYNQAVLAGGWLYCSGQIPLDAETGLMVGDGDVAAETRQVLKNLVAVLNAADASPAQVVRTTVFLADLADFQTVNKIYAEVFGDGVSPARACVQVAALPKGARVEIDCVAWLGGDSQMR
ncbi:MAG: Rid family detoxifying hydrolase [Cyanobacteria bacterium]|jgi:reactive intermediate/imine deaminase|nr:RidA family protein [Synechococcus sp. BS307-5m-G38]MDA0257077.1 Rid family detoxifying hydrolase [Cyanobacteriota bacterium]OUW28642.1 MAG: reactive intermediate/imine deaminase [Cyanobacteria bacterium TMED177]